jgi:hypothetical protein
VYQVYDGLAGLEELVLFIQLRRVSWRIVWLDQLL